MAVTQPTTVTPLKGVVCACQYSTRAIVWVSRRGSPVRHFASAIRTWFIVRRGRPTSDVIRLDFTENSRVSGRMRKLPTPTHEAARGSKERNFRLASFRWLSLFVRARIRRQPHNHYEYEYLVLVDGQNHVLTSENQGPWCQHYNAMN